MRYIQAPDDITVFPPKHIQEQIRDSGGEVKGARQTFRAYAFDVWLDDNRAIEGGFSKQVRWSKVIDSFQENAVPGRWISMEDEDWNMLKGIVEKPSRALPPHITVQLMAFSRAVLEATDAIPSVLTPAASAPS
jgi:hypothetical protein